MITVEPVVDEADIEQLADVHARAFASSFTSIFPSGPALSEPYKRFRRSQVRRQFVASNDVAQNRLRARNAASLLKAVEYDAPPREQAHGKEADEAMKKGRIVGVVWYHVVPPASDARSREKLKQADEALPPLEYPGAEADFSRETWDMMRETLGKDELELVGDRERISVPVVAVAESARGKGVGRLMIQALQAHARRLSSFPATTRTTPTPSALPIYLAAVSSAVPFYKACGFEIPRVLQNEKWGFDLHSSLYTPPPDERVQQAVARAKETGEKVRVEALTFEDDLERCAETYLAAFIPGFEDIFPRTCSLSQDCMRFRTRGILRQLISSTDERQRALRSGQGIDGLDPSSFPVRYGTQVLKATLCGEIVGVTWFLTVPGKSVSHLGAEQAHERLRAATKEADALLPPMLLPAGYSGDKWQAIMQAMEESEDALIGAEDHIHVPVIVVDPRAHGSGAGRAIVDAIVQAGTHGGAIEGEGNKTAVLPVHLDAIRTARPFYKRLGFTEHGTLGADQPSWGFVGYPSILRR